MKNYQALAYELKAEPGTYISKDGPGLTLDLEDAFIYARKDGLKPIKSEIIDLAKDMEDSHKALMVSLYGINASVNFKPYTWLEDFNLVEVEISEERYRECLEEVY